MHSEITAKQKSIEEPARAQVQSKKKRNPQQDLCELIRAFNQRTVIARVICILCDQIARQQCAIQIVEGSLVHKAADIILTRAKDRAYEFPIYSHPKVDSYRVKHSRRNRAKRCLSRPMENRSGNYR